MKSTRQQEFEMNWNEDDLEFNDLDNDGDDWSEELDIMEEIEEEEEELELIEKFNILKGEW